MGQGKGNNSFSISRLDALTDGIFAIAMTILVLNIEVPDLPAGADTADMLGELKKIVPQILSFVLSFYILAQIWVSYNRQRKLFRSTAMGHIWLTMAGLLMVCLIPFSTSFVDDHGGNLVAELFFHLNLLLAGLACYSQWAYAAKDQRLLHDEVSEKRIRQGLRLRVLLPSAALAAILFAILIDPGWSSVTYLALPFTAGWMARHKT